MKPGKRVANTDIEILVVEDSPTQAEQLRYLLEGAEYKVTLATNGKEALAAARQRKPTLIISDIVMPEMDGYTLCKAIKSDEQLKDVPVILVTTLSGPQDVLKGLECGADSFIRKPYDEKYLRSRIEYILANRALGTRERTQMGLEIYLGGQRHFITAERQQILGLLISTYEEAIQLDEGLKRSYQSLNGLYHIAKGLNQAYSEQEVLEQVLERAQELPGVQAGWIYLREGETGLRVAATRGLPSALQAQSALEGDCLCRRKLLSGELDQVTNILECERLQKVKGDTGSPRHHASIPLHSGDQTVGIVNLVGTGQGQFSDDDLQILSGVGNQVGIALERARLYEHLEKMVEERTAALTAEIAERTRAQEALRRSEEYFRALIENASDAIMLLGADRRIKYASPSTQRVLGYRPEEAIGANPAEFTHPDDRSIIETVLTDLLQKPGQVVTAQYRFRHQDGSWRWLESTISNLMAEPSVEAIVFNFRDITDRKQAEERIRREAARAEALVRTAARLNAQLDLAGVLNAVCEETARALNAPAASVSLYDAKREVISNAADFGLPSEYHERVRPLSRADYDECVRRLGPLAVVPDVQSLPGLPNADLYAALNIRTIAGASMRREGQLVGSLNVITFGQVRQFSEDELALLQALANQASQAITNARLYEQANRRLDQVQALRTIDVAITSSLDLNLTLGIFLDQVMTQLGIDAADVLLLNPHTQILEYAAGRGFRTSVFQHTRLRLGEGMAGAAALERRVVHLADLKDKANGLVRAPLLTNEGFSAYYAAPLIAKAQVKGVLEVFHRSALQPDEEWLNFLEALAGQAAIAIDNTTLFEGLQRSNVELVLAYQTTLEGWSRALDLRDKETEGHTLRVTEMTLRLARALAVSEAEIVHIERGALLHDIGKMGVPDAILLKPGPLSDEEWVIMRKHPVYAFELLSPIAYLRPALDIPYAHHEKWDGSGYPRGLKAEKIPLAARIFAVIDVWDALRSDRPYRAGWPEHKVREHIRSLAGTHFDRQVVETFLSMRIEL